MFTAKNIITKVWIFLDRLKKKFFDFCNLVCLMDELNTSKEMRKTWTSNIPDETMIDELEIDDKSG